MAIINGLPFGVGMAGNDGSNVLELSRNPEAVRALWIQLKASEMLSRGIRLKDMPDEWFEMPSDLAMKGVLITTIAVCRCNRLMDERRFEEADSQMADILSKECALAGVHRAMLLNDRMYIELIGSCRQDVLDNMLSKEDKKILKAMSTSISVKRTEYAYALLSEHDAQKAEGTLEKFEQIAKSYPYPSEVLAERELMDRALKKSEDLRELMQ